MGSRVRGERERRPAIEPALLALQTTMIRSAALIAAAVRLHAGQATPAEVMEEARLYAVWIAEGKLG